jgi:hypothetical protein
MEEPPLDAYEREFNPPEREMGFARPRFNLAGRKPRSTGIYCGNKNPAPNGRPRGTPNQCFKKGFAVGVNVGTDRGATEGREYAIKKARVNRQITKPRQTDASTQIYLPTTTSFSTQTQSIPERNPRTALVAGETAAIARERSNLKTRLKREGLAALKNSLRLSNMNKDEIRSLAVRLTGTPNAIQGYSRMSVDQLRQELVNRGWQM